MRMKPRFCGVPVLLVSLVTALAAAQTASTAPAERKALSLTLYTSGSSLVRDTRAVNLPQGFVQLRFPDVADQLLPDSVQVESTTAAGKISVIGQSYSYGLLSSYSLMRAYVGKKITLVMPGMKDGSEADEPVEATLLAAPGPVFLINGKVETGIKVNRYIFPSVPAGLTAQRSLTFQVENEHPGPRDVRVSYLTNGLNWAANYVLTVTSDWKTARLAGRALIHNESGADFPNAAVQVVAGELHRVSEGRPFGGLGNMSPPSARYAMAAPASPVQRPFAGYHLYTLQQRLDLLNNASQQAPLLPAAEIRITRTYEVNGQAYYNQAAQPEASLKRPVELQLEFENRKANSLGAPLPAGIARVYKNDSSGRLQLVGEDRMEGTAEGERVTLNLGNAFDVVEDGKQTDFQKLGPNSAEASYEIALRNHQSQPIVVTVNEPFNGDWQILSSSLAYTKTSSTSAQFSVPVPANGETVLKYRVRTQW